jgi:uncharacterized protein YjbJ (UPF0337 family)
MGTAIPRSGRGYNGHGSTTFQETPMNKEQVKGRIEEATGKVKEVAGQVVGNKDLEEKGSIQKNAGKARANIGDLADDIKKSD